MSGGTSLFGSDLWHTLFFYVFLCEFIGFSEVNFIMCRIDFTLYNGKI